jgi:hypothetical protein
MGREIRFEGVYFGANIITPWIVINKKKMI